MRRRGSVNPIDLLALAGMAASLGLGAACYGVMAQPTPRVQALSPASVMEDEFGWLTLEGDRLDEARVVIIGSRMLTPSPELASPSRLRVYVKPSTMGLLPGRYEVRVVNGWGRGERVPQDLEVTPAPWRVAHTLQAKLLELLSESDLSAEVQQELASLAKMLSAVSQSSPEAAERALEDLSRLLAAEPPAQASGELAVSGGRAADDHAGSRGRLDASR